MKVNAIHVWVRYKKPDGNTRKKIIIKPKSQEIKAMKMEIAQAVKPLLNKIISYYVVIQVRLPRGKMGYRTVIPLQMV